jgi:hypothetical protein
MRVMAIYKPADTRDMEACLPPTPERMEEMGRLIEELVNEGKLLQTDGLLGTSKGARVRLDNGKFTVTDGPFTESKELIAGYAILNVASLQEAIELAQRFLKVAGDGESEIRQMHDAPSYEHDPIPSPEYPLAS